MSLFLGIEGGATRSSAVVMNAAGKVVARVDEGPGNVRLLTDEQVLKLWRRIHAGLGSLAVTAVGAFVAGCRTAEDVARIKRLLKVVWPEAMYAVGNDGTSALAGALEREDGIVLICGTGSIVLARRGGRRVQVGGWGHVGGDAGSGYWLGRELLRLAFFRHDDLGRTDRLIQELLRFLGLNTMEELVNWSLSAGKDEVASLTRVVFAQRRDAAVRRLLAQAAELLAADVVRAARKLAWRTPLVALNRGLALHQPTLLTLVRAAVRRRLPGARVVLAAAGGDLGAARLARYLVEDTAATTPATIKAAPSATAAAPTAAPSPAKELAARGLGVALTEQRNPRTLDLDRQPVTRLVRTLLTEEKATIPAILAQERAIAQVIGWIVTALRGGGRLFYLGAGTSGRVGVLDASEVPPTFGCDPILVQGIMAGGMRALYQAGESAEDDAEYGRATVRDRGIGRGDVLVGIAASGSTPFVLGALTAAHARGAKTVLLTFNPAATFRLPGRDFRRIAIATGPEAITGSTRLKAGTATKLVLNLFSSISMIRLGKVRSNLMVDLNPACEKLHARAARIYAALGGVSEAEAWARLEANGWDLKTLLSTGGKAKKRKQEMKSPAKTPRRRERKK